MRITKTVNFAPRASVACVAAIAGFALAAPAAAGNGQATQDITLSAEVPELCKIESAFDQTTFEIPVSDGKPTASDFSTDTTITCNTPTDIELISTQGGVAHDSHRLVPAVGLEDAAYLTGFDYTAEIVHEDLPEVSLDTSATPGFGAEETTGKIPAFDPSTTKPNTVLTLNVTTQAVDPAKAMQAGSYEDTLRVRVLPQ